MTIWITKFTSKLLKKYLLLVNDDLLKEDISIGISNTQYSALSRSRIPKNVTKLQQYLPEGDPAESCGTPKYAKTSEAEFMMTKMTIY